jgi:hypothetical protein
MPGAGIMRAKQNRAGSLGQSSRNFFALGCTLGLKKPGAQGFGIHNASIGSTQSLNNVKQKRVVPGLDHNVCKKYNTCAQCPTKK